MSEKTGINLITLGCPKNLIDSELIAGSLFKEGYFFTSSPHLADFIIINTCAFIDSAVKESEEKISEICKYKRSNQKIIVCGCLPQLKRKKLFEKFPEIDALLGSSDFPKINNIIKKLEQKEYICSVGNPSFIYSTSDTRAISTCSSGYAYIKISEGCNNRCHYCLIPKLRGKFRSRKIEDILEETKILVGSGIKEIILIAQDTTLYGYDIYNGRLMLPTLLEKLSLIDGLHWIRILYTHPAHFTDSTIKSIAEIDKVCKYIEIPIQHTCDDILRKMGRPESKTIFKTIERLRKCVPDIALRTTVMVGFPGETDAHFKKLLNDIKKLEFDWLGCFEYSRQKGTKANKLKDNVKKTIKESRKHELLELQKEITYRKNKEKLGKIWKVLVENGKFGHAEFQAPEIDGRIIIKNAKRKILPGNILPVKLEKIDKTYDILGTLVSIPE